MNILPPHGVLLSLKNTGLFLIGKSGVGKSETALQLIHEGAVLICDDAPDITVDNTNQCIMGSCPEGFYGLMHLRDIGIINIIELFGLQYFKKKQSIDLVIELIQGNHQGPIEANVTLDYTPWQYNEKNKQACWNIPGIALHLSPNRNIALLIQTAVAQFAYSNQLSNKPQNNRKIEKK